MITVCLCTKRKEPKFDWAINSLKNQTFKDFEYIIIDGYYNDRKDAIRKFLKDQDVSFPIIYLKDKPSRWKGKRPAVCNARNTALTFANGEYIVYHDDECKMPTNWLERHYKWLRQGYIVAGSWKGCDNRWEHRYHLIKEPGTVIGGWLYSCNCSFPLKVAMDINGFDEELDGEMGQEDINFGIRATRKGYKIMYDPFCYVEYDYTFHNSIMKSMNREYKRKILRDGKEHFSNEWHTQKLLDDTNTYYPYGNYFNLLELRKMVRKLNDTESSYKELERYIDKNPFDWRDNENIQSI